MRDALQRLLARLREHFRLWWHTHIVGEDEWGV